MFRTVLPRATPRAALRAGPKAVPSTFIASPMLWIGSSKRGYASEAGESILEDLSGDGPDCSPYLPVYDC